MLSKSAKSDKKSHNFNISDERVSIAVIIWRDKRRQEIKLETKRKSKRCKAAEKHTEVV